MAEIHPPTGIALLDAVGRRRKPDALPRANLRALGNTLAHNGVTQWTYTSDRTLDAVVAPGFFNDACNMMKRGDPIWVVAKDRVALLYVYSVSPEKVVVSLLSGGLTEIAP